MVNKLDNLKVSGIMYLADNHFYKIMFLFGAYVIYKYFI